MKNEQVIKWLKRYQESMKKLSILADHIATIRSKVGNAYGSGVNLNDAGKCTTQKASNPIHDLTIELQELESNYKVLLKETSKIEREVILTIHSLPIQAFIEKELLTNKYVYFYPNEKNYKELNILKKTFEYHLDVGLMMISKVLIDKGEIIPMELTNKSGYEVLIDKLMN